MHLQKSVLILVLSIIPWQMAASEIDTLIMTCPQKIHGFYQLMKDVHELFSVQTLRFIHEK